MPHSHEAAAATPESSHDSQEPEASAAWGGPPDERIAETAPGRSLWAEWVNDDWYSHGFPLRRFG
jgi:hypothetical protein